MYKLMLATNQPEVLAAFTAFPSWDALGFRTPRIVSSAQEAIEKLKMHHVDGIAFALGSKEDTELYQYLCDEHPILPIFEACRTTTDITRAVKELRSLLNRLRSDYSNDDFTERDMLQICRHEYLRALLGGRIHTRKDVLNHLLLLRSRMDPYRPCVVLNMTIPEGDAYLSDRWHYGPERLEVALRNILGAELDGMRMLASVLPDAQVRLLCCPMLGADIHGDSITATVSHHAQDSMDHIREYLGLSLQITNIQVLPALTALAIEA